MYQVLAIVSMSIAVLLLWKLMRSIFDRIERLEDATDHLGGRLALLEDAMALPPVENNIKVEAAETASEAASEDFGHPEPVVQQQQQVTEVITLIDCIDDEAKQMRKELRKRGLPARGGIDEMRARLAEAEATTTPLVAVVAAE